MNRFLTSLLALLLLASGARAQPERWQQRVKYNMDVKLDVATNLVSGKQKLEYFNNSPDTLFKIFYHLYWNAFQPGSMMDVRSRSLPDPDPRVRDRISKLKPDQIGYQKIQSLKMDGRAQRYIVKETILEVVLDRPILPKSRVVLDMDFESQVPVQIRRSGRDNAEGVRYSMSQWYPKLCEYDYQGWHANPYIAREFYGVWGDFEVKITLDKTYLVGGTGYLQNPNQIGFGYEAPGAKVVKPAGNTLTWHFVAPNVHDFVWAADPNYRHISKTMPGSGIVLNVIYRNANNSARADQEWQKVLDAAAAVLPFIEKKFGAYPYKQYSFIQGGDGGMEYPMATLLKGPGLGTVFHEWMHTWYQMLMGTNESLYAWMDEGFTSFAEEEVSAYYRKLNGGSDDPDLPLNHSGGYSGYFSLAKSGKEEPMTTHADHYNTNFAYSLDAYSKGEVFLTQLGYIISDSLRDKTLLEYYRLWRFKHPNPNDFIRVAEKVSGLELDWYKEYFVHTTRTIDYGIDSLWEEGGKTNIRLRRIGMMPMPVDVVVTYKDGTREMLYVPLGLMYGEKPAEYGLPRISMPGWPWTNATFTVSPSRRLTDVVRVEIDPSRRMADMNPGNNRLDLKW